MTEQRPSGQKMVLCCGRKKRCPEITAVDGGYVLSDVDQNEPGTVKLTREQAEQMWFWLGRMLHPETTGTGSVKLDGSRDLFEGLR